MAAPRPTASDGQPRITALARQRRHAVGFLDEIRSFSPVFLDTDVDMTAVQRHRAAARRDGKRFALVVYVVHAAARVLAAHPEANAAISGRIRPRVARYQTVNGKVALDKWMRGHRVVLSTVLPDVHRASLAEIQARIDPYRTGDPDVMPEFAGVRTLQRLPLPIGRALFRLSIRSLRRRARLLGTFSVTSLGHRPVNGFYSVGGTTITLGMGQLADRPVARDGRVTIAPTLRLNLTFDHRVIDGAEAADVLAEVRDRLETFPADPPSADRPRSQLETSPGKGTA